MLGRERGYTNHAPAAPPPGLLAAWAAIAGGKIPDQLEGETARARG